MKSLVELINESKQKTWSKITAWNGNKMSESLSNFAFSLNMKKIERKYRRECGINNIGTKDQIAAIKYELNSVWIRYKGDMPSAQDVANKLNISTLGYSNWEPENEDAISVTIKCKDAYGNMHYIKCWK